MWARGADDMANKERVMYVKGVRVHERGQASVSGGEHLDQRKGFGSANGSSVRKRALAPVGGGLGVVKRTPVETVGAQLVSLSMLILSLVTDGLPLLAGRGREKRPLERRLRRFELSPRAGAGDNFSCSSARSWYLLPTASNAGM